jgi:hypothetical protein
MVTRRVQKKDEHGNLVTDDKGKPVTHEVAEFKSVEEARAHAEFSDHAMKQESDVVIHTCDDPLQLMEEHMDDGVFPAIYDLAFMWENSEQPSSKKK